MGNAWNRGSRRKLNKKLTLAEKAGDQVKKVQTKLIEQWFCKGIVSLNIFSKKKIRNTIKCEHFL